MTHHIMGQVKCQAQKEEREREKKTAPPVPISSAHTTEVRTYLVLACTHHIVIQYHIEVSSTDACSTSCNQSRPDERQPIRAQRAGQPTRTNSAHFVRQAPVRGHSVADNYSCVTAALKRCATKRPTGSILSCADSACRPCGQMWRYLCHKNGYCH